MLNALWSKFMNIPIGYRLMGGFLALAVVCGFVGYSGHRSMTGTRALHENAIKNLLPSVIHLANARGSALRAQRAERTQLIALRQGDEEQYKIAQAHQAAALKTLEDSLAGYGALPMAAKEQALWKEVQPALAEWKRDSDEVTGHLAKRDTAKAETAMGHEIKSANRLLEQLTALIDLQSEVSTEEAKQADDLFAAAKMTTVLTVSIACALALGLGLLLTVSITRPVAQAVAVLECVTRGDLTQRAAADSKDEMGRLGTALNATIDCLQAGRERDLDFRGQLAAINKVQAVIEFKLDGTIVTANDNFLNTLGYVPPEIQGRHHSTFVEPAVAGSPEYREFWAKLNRGEFVAGEFKRIGKGGKEIWIQASYNPILGLDGKPYKVVKFATDITANKRMELQVRENSAEQLQAVEELRRKMDAIRVGVAALAAGDFTVTIPNLGDDNVGQMAAALNQAVVTVRIALEGVRDVSEQLADASGQLAAASEEISTGAQEQASSLEETASTLEEITSTVRQSSDNAQQARQLASSSKEVAEKGGSVVSGAVDAMSEINASSKKIAEIITAIDEIAFQTNLLALNAAVEAARAGEQGRGFAVVAAEVRNLAQRSATAAKEIKSLINDSVKKVDAGTELVNRSGSTLAEIVTSVKRVTDIVTEMAAASKEQSSGIEQVNKAVSQMDAVTQRNASQTEEMSATAQTLTDQAAQLRDLVTRFKLGGDADRAPARPAPKAGKKPAPATKPRPAVARALKNGHSNGNGHGHELDALAGSDDGFTEF